MSNWPTDVGQQKLWLVCVILAVNTPSMTPARILSSIEVELPLKTILKERKGGLARQVASIGTLLWTYC